MADYKISQLTPVTPTSDDLLEVSHTTDSGVTFNTGSVSVADLSSAVADNITAADIEFSSGVSVADKIDDLDNTKIAKASLSAVFTNSNMSASIGNAKSLFNLGNDDTIDYVGVFCNGQPLVAFTNSSGNLFCGAVLGSLNATYAFQAICFYH